MQTKFLVLILTGALYAQVPTIPNEAFPAFRTDLNTSLGLVAPRANPVFTVGFTLGTTTIDPTTGLAIGGVVAVYANDSRLTNSRAPNGSASGDLSGSYPGPTVAKVNGQTPGGTCTNQFARSVDSSGRPTCASIVSADFPANIVFTGTITNGTTVTDSVLGITTPAVSTNTTGGGFWSFKQGTSIWPNAANSVGWGAPPSYSASTLLMLPAIPPTTTNTLLSCALPGSNLSTCSWIAPGLPITGGTLNNASGVTQLIIKAGSNQAINPDPLTLWQDVSGNNLFKLEYDGTLTVGDGYAKFSNTGSTPSMRLNTNGYLSFSGNADPGTTKDVSLYRSAAGTIAVGSGAGSGAGKFAPGNGLTGHAVCFNGTVLSYCTSVVASDGTCTCH